MNLKKRFLDECGVDLTDYEYAGKFPSRNKYGRWGNIPRGEGWKKYAEWLEKLVTNNGSASVSNAKRTVCDCCQKNEARICAECGAN